MMWDPFITNTLHSPYQERYPVWFFFPLRSDVFSKCSFNFLKQCIYLIWFFFLPLHYNTSQNLTESLLCWWIISSFVFKLWIKLHHGNHFTHSYKIKNMFKSWKIIHLSLVTYCFIWPFWVCLFNYSQKMGHREVYNDNAMHTWFGAIKPSAV